MCNKAMIMEIKPFYCIALTSDGSVIRLKKKEGVKEGDRIYYLPEDLYTDRPSSASDKVIGFGQMLSKRALQFTGSAAALLLIFTLLFTSLFSRGPVYAATVSIDAGQDLQLDLDREGKVIQAVSRSSAFSEEELAHFKGQSIEDILDEVLGKAAYFDESTVIIGYASKDEGGAPIDRSIQNYIENNRGKEYIWYLKGKHDDIEKASASGLSLGMYIAGKAVSEGEIEAIENDKKKKSRLLEYLSEQSKVMENDEFREAIEEEKEQLRESSEEVSPGEGDAFGLDEDRDGHEGKEESDKEKDDRGEGDKEADDRVEDDKKENDRGEGDKEAVDRVEDDNKEDDRGRDNEVDDKSERDKEEDDKGKGDNGEDDRGEDNDAADLGDEGAETEVFSTAADQEESTDNPYIDVDEEESGEGGGRDTVSDTEGVENIGTDDGGDQGADGRDENRDEDRADDDGGDDGVDTGGDDDPEGD